MPIQLDKILADIADEPVLHPNYPEASKKDIDDAWQRVGKNNKLTVHEARSIFKVLQKKYDQEKDKRTSSWKLFGIMEEIHRKLEIKPETKTGEDCEMLMEEDEEYEMLEVQEDDEPGQSTNPLPPGSSGSLSDNETKSITSNVDSPDKDDIKPSTTAKILQRSSLLQEEKKLLNSMASASPKQATTPSATSTASSVSSTTLTTTTNATTITAAAALHRKGITLKKTTVGNIVAKTPSVPTNAASITIKSTPRTGVIEVGKTIQLPDSIKRKLTEDHNSSQMKKINIGHNITTQLISNNPASTSTTSAAMRTMQQQQHQTAASSVAAAVAQQQTSTLVQIKQEKSDDNDINASNLSSGINIITIPANPIHPTDLTNGIGISGGTSSTAATVASTSINGYSPRNDDIDLNRDIIFDPNATGLTTNGGDNKFSSSDIINFGNFDNTLPPTFFKNLCNSSRHEALGLYVANVMNRLRPRLAAKLELGILRAIVDAQSDELEQ